MAGQRRALRHVGIAAARSLICGVLLAALVFPMVGGVGLAAKAGADAFLQLRRS